MKKLNRVPAVYYGEQHFGSSRLEEVVPNLNEIPEVYKRKDNEWRKIIETWNKFGVHKDVNFISKEGVSTEKSFKFISAIIESRYTLETKRRKAAATMFCDQLFYKIIF